MHLAQRTYLLLAAIAIVAIAGTWTTDPLLNGLWRLPAALLLLALTLEGAWMQRTRLSAAVEIAPRCFLGRLQPAALVVRNPGPRDLTLQYAPVVPAGFEPLGTAREMRAAAGGAGRDEWRLVPVRLGPQSWPPLPARVLGRLGLAWWSRDLVPDAAVRIAPDTLTSGRRPSGLAAGQRSRRVAGAGSELLQLREYLPGDPLSRIDWKATARSGALVTREFSEDQHLDIVVALDAGRASRTPAGALDRLGLYANIAARFAEHAVRHDDRVGLCVFSDRVLHDLPPARGTGAVIRVRSVLESLVPEPAESDPVAAAARIRGRLSHRSLVVLLADFGDIGSGESLPRAVRILAPPHLAVVAGVRSPVVARLAASGARSWRDPWIALAAAEHEARITARLELLRRLGAPVIAAREEILEGAVIDEYERLRRRRSI